MTLTLQKSLTPKTIQVGFKVANILPLNREAMIGKMGASEIFQHNHEAREDFEEENEAFEDQIDLEIKEILEEGIPSPSRHYTNYYVSIEDESFVPSISCTMAKSNSLQSCSQFLRLPQIQETISTRMRSESIVDYSHSQFLTSNDNVQNLKIISDRKKMVEEERVTKQGEGYKARRAEERLFEAIAKRRRASELKARKQAKLSWTTTAIRAAGERMQSLMKNASPQQIREPRFDLESMAIAK